MYIQKCRCDDNCKNNDNCKNDDNCKKKIIILTTTVKKVNDNCKKRNLTTTVKKIQPTTTVKNHSDDNCKNKLFNFTKYCRVGICKWKMYYFAHKGIVLIHMRDNTVPLCTDQYLPIPLCTDPNIPIPLPRHMIHLIDTCGTSALVVYWRWKLQDVACFGNRSWTLWSQLRLLLYGDTRT